MRLIIFVKQKIIVLLPMKREKDQAVVEVKKIKLKKIKSIIFFLKTGMPILKRDGTKITADFSKWAKNDETVEKTQVYSAEKVLEIFKRISNEDCIAMGLNPKWARPEWM